MLTKIKKTIQDYGMLNLNNITGQNPERVIIALSGGADSVSLLYAFNMLKKNNEIDIKLEACHVNHNLRDEESNRDELFVRKLCMELNIPLTVRSVNVKELLLLEKNKHVSVEECARNVRYSFFNEIGADAKIATAHTANDNCETVLLNMIRGTGLKGLCGIPPVRDNIIRPLIHVDRMEIENFCSEHNLEYVIDSSNLSEDYTRNKLRLNVMPQLQKINPSLTACLGRMCRNIRDDEAFLSNLAEDTKNRSVIKKNDGKTCYDAGLLINQPLPVLHRIISSILTQNNISPSTLRISGIEEILCKGKGKINLVKNKFAVVADNELYLENIHQNYKKKS